MNISTKKQSPLVTVAFLPIENNWLLLYNLFARRKQMPVWEKKCPKCGRPIDLDTQSSKIYCSYCNTQFWTDEFINKRTKYHTKKKSGTKTSKADWSAFFSALTGTSKKSTRSKSKSKQMDFEAIGCLIVIMLFSLPFALIIYFFQSLL